MSSIHSIWTGKSRRGRTPRRLFALPRAVLPGMRIRLPRRLCTVICAMLPLLHFLHTFFRVYCRQVPELARKTGRRPESRGRKAENSARKAKHSPERGRKGPRTPPAGQIGRAFCPFLHLIALHGQAGDCPKTARCVPRLRHGSRDTGYRVPRGAGDTISRVSDIPAGGCRFRRLPAPCFTFLHRAAPGSALCHGPQKSGLRGLSSRTCRGAPAVISRRRRI